MTYTMTQFALMRALLFRTLDATHVADPRYPALLAVVLRFEWLNHGGAPKHTAGRWDEEVGFPFLVKVWPFLRGFQAIRD